MVKTRLRGIRAIVSAEMYCYSAIVRSECAHYVFTGASGILRRVIYDIARSAVKGHLD